MATLSGQLQKHAPGGTDPSGLVTVSPATSQEGMIAQASLTLGSVTNN